MKKLNDKGFSLIEIIAAIAILAVLMTLAANAYNIYKRKARQQAYDTMAKSATSAATNYLMENAKEKYITFEILKENDYIDTLQDPRYKSEQCTGIVINKVVQGSNQKQLDTLFQKVKLCCKNYKYQYDYTGEDVKVTEIDNCNYVDGDEIDGVYKLIYKPQGGSACNPKSVIKQQGEEWGTLCVTTRTKYVFKGWNTKKNGSGSKITASTKVGDKDINAYAIWNPIYTLKFDPDGGTACNPASIDKEKGNKWGTLCQTTRTGYAFKGWNTKKSGKGSTVTSNTYAEKDMTVYAEWNPYYTLTFDSKGGTACNPGSITKENGEKWGTLCAPTRNGYVFKGWNTKADGSGNTITENTKVLSNITAYAIWNPKYTLTYNSNGGTACNPATVIKENGKKWGTLCAPTRTGYTFQGWKSGSTTITKDSICSGNITVTADWKANGYTLTYNNNGGSGCTTKAGKYDSAWGTLCAPTRTGYTFGGWKNGSTTINQNTICKGNLSVTASWSANGYTLTYNNNGGSGCTTKAGTYDLAWGTLCTPSRTGYTFQSWKNGSTTINQNTKCAGDLTVTANWRANAYTLTYNNNGGSGCTTKTGTYDSAWGTLCTPSKTGYTFQGWKSGSTTITNNSKCTGDLTVTASWKANCPAGYTLQSNGTCTKTYNATAKYKCPSGGTLSGTNCVSSSTYSASATGYSGGCSWDKDGGHTSKSNNQSGAVWSKNVECSASNEGETRKFYDCGRGKVSCRNPDTGRYNCKNESCKSANLRYTYKMGTCTCYGSKTYSCPSGGTLSGRTCTKSSSYAATKYYVCNSGDTLSGTTCTNTVNPS